MGWHRLKQVAYKYYNLKEQIEMQREEWHLASNRFDNNFLYSNLSEER